MLRRKKRCCRKIGGERVFKPVGLPLNIADENIIDLDEFEAMRLCDLDGLNQIEASEVMKISRGTVQRLLKLGRFKLMDSLLKEKVIIINKREVSYE